MRTILTETIDSIRVTSGGVTSGGVLSLKKVSAILIASMGLMACSGEGSDTPSPSPEGSPTVAPTGTPTEVTPTAAPTAPPTPTHVPTPTGTPVVTPVPFIPPPIADGYQFWVGELGPIGPLFSGPQQYPFICATNESNLGQPVIDNKDGLGNAVFPEVDGVPDTSALPVGNSANCSIYTRVDYFYFSVAENQFKKLLPETPETDVAKVMVKGQEEKFVVRVEAGTLNRFIYTIAMLAPYEESLESPAGLDNSAWGKRLLYYFRGGVGIGHYQGFAAWHDGLSGVEDAAFRKAFEMGYAVVTSTGNETGVHYNMQLAEETAYMVKEHFKATYGEPLYTVGAGGSGGGVQQYLIGQNQGDRKILDAGIPMYSYPDMVTQTTPIGDCNLIEQYFLDDVTAKGESSKWAKWSNRSWIEGLNASDTADNMLYEAPGSTECIEAWLFGEPLVLNPQFTLPDYLEALATYRYPAADIAAIKWTHFNDLENIYGTDARGFAHVPFDNEGVQYGLQALKDGNITTAEFLEINSCIGTWVEQPDYVNWNPIDDPFDSNNMLRDPEACRAGEPQPRRVGELDAIQAAYSSRQVFVGDIDIPLIDLRPYLEEELDMHNSKQSFAARQRMLDFDGNASNQVIWFTGPNDDFIARVVEALNVLDTYLVGDAMPSGFVDRCYGNDGTLLAEGPTVWDGILNTNAPGVCTQTYQIKSSSRLVAGEPISGNVFKCALQSVDEAKEAGIYGDVSFTTDEEAYLRTIFETGVCDYSLPDVGILLPSK